MESQLEAGGTEIAPGQVHFHLTGTVGFEVLESEVQGLGTVAVKDVGIIGASPVDDVIIVLFIDLIIQKLRHQGGPRCYWEGGRLDSSSSTQVGGDKGVGMVVVGIGKMTEKPFLGVILPSDRPPGIEQDIVIAVERTVLFALDEDRQLGEVVETRLRVDLVQEASSVMIDTEVSGIKVIHVHTQIGEVVIGKPIHARGVDPNLEPSSRRQHGMVGIVAVNRLSPGA